MLNFLQKELNVSLITEKLRLFLFSLGFIALAVFVPWFFHHFQLLGQIFLPLHFFTLLAGLAFGFQSGFLVGIASPVISFLLSGMPVAILLPIIIPEIATYGFVAGVLRKRTNLYFALIVSLISGRIVSLLMAAIFLSKQNPLVYLANALKLGLPGIILQLLLVPVIAKQLERFA